MIKTDSLVKGRGRLEAWIGASVTRSIIINSIALAQLPTRMGATTIRTLRFYKEFAETPLCLLTNL